MIKDLCGGNLGGIRECGKRLKAFNAAWARLQTEEPGWCEDPLDQEFDSKLKSWLRFHQAILVGELVPEALHYLRQNPTSSERSHFTHVLVDEYQDLNRAEQVLLDLLAENSHLTIIGDEDQSIYSFKHAHPVGVAEFHLVHDGTHDEHLDECRRCPTTVVDMANRLIANNRSRTSRTLRPKHGNPQGDLAVVQWRTMADEAHGIAEFIKTRINSGAVSAGQVLVLATRRKFGYAVRDALNAISTPVYSFFNEEALDGNPKKIEECSAAEAYTLLAQCVQGLCVAVGA